MNNIAKNSKNPLENIYDFIQKLPEAESTLDLAEIETGTSYLDIDYRTSRAGSESVPDGYRHHNLTIGYQKDRGFGIWHGTEASEIGLNPDEVYENLESVLKRFYEIIHYAGQGI